MDVRRRTELEDFHQSDIVTTANGKSKPGEPPLALMSSTATPEYGTEDRSPLFVIGNRSWTELALHDLWSHRELFYILAWRDVKVRYKQSLLGALWVVLQPLLTMLVFTLLFGRLARIPSDGEPYAIFSYAGLLPWTFFSTAVTAGSNSIVNSSNLVTKVYFPRLLIPTAAVGAGLIDLAIASLLLLVLLPFYGRAFHMTLLMLVPLVGLLVLTAAAVAAFTAALNVKYRDIRYALPFVVQMWMFVTPVIYPASFLPARWAWILSINPLTGIIAGFRSAIFGRAFDWPAIASSAVVAGVLFLVCTYSFRHMEQQFADVI